MSEAARVASRAHKKLFNSHCLSSVNSEQFKPIWTQVRKSNNFWSRRSVNLKPPQRSRKRDDGNFNPDRAQDSDSNTSQDQEGNTVEKDCAEKPESASAQESPVHIDNQKGSNLNAQVLSDHFGTTKAAEKSVWIPIGRAKVAFLRSPTRAAPNRYAPRNATFRKYHRVGALPET